MSRQLFDPTWYRVVSHTEFQLFQNKVEQLSMALECVANSEGTDLCSRAALKILMYELENLKDSFTADPTFMTQPLSVCLATQENPAQEAHHE